MKKKMQNVGTKSAFMPIFIELFFYLPVCLFYFIIFIEPFFFFNEFVLLSVFPLLPNYKSSGFLQ